MVRSLLFAALAAGLCVAPSGSGLAAERKDADTKSNITTGKSGAKPSESARAVDDLVLAHSLIHYGRKNRSPQALVTAAQILAKLQPEAVKEKPTREKGPGAEASAEPRGTAADNSPKALLAEARKMSRAPHVAALAEAAEKSLEESARGAAGGPKRDEDVLPTGMNVVYTVTFVAGEEARAAVVGDGSSQLDMYVYDEGGHLLRRAVGPGDRCVCSWVPAWTGKFKIKIVNSGSSANRYAFGTN